MSFMCVVKVDGSDLPSVIGMENTCHRRKSNKYCLYQLEITCKIHAFLLHCTVYFMTLLKLFDCLHLFTYRLLLLFANLK